MLVFIDQVEVMFMDIGMLLVAEELETFIEYGADIVEEVETFIEYGADMLEEVEVFMEYGAEIVDIDEELIETFF